MALDYTGFEQIVATAKNAESTKAELKKALKRVNSAIEALQVSLSDMSQILSDDYVPAERKKAGRKPGSTSATKADGTPKAKPGRKSKAEKAEAASE